MNMNVAAIARYLKIAKFSIRGTTLQQDFIKDILVMSRCCDVVIRSMPDVLKRCTLSISKCSIAFHVLNVGAALEFSLDFSPSLQKNSRMEQQASSSLCMVFE